MLGKYQLLRRLAIGGMAEIFLARATGIEGFEKLVVLKRILPQLAADERFVRMFLKEARLAATLHHSNIAQVYDIGLVSGTYFFTMEFIHGVDVREIWKSARDECKPIPLEIGVAITLGAAAGLHYAHEKQGPDGQLLGIVHRDVSPSNVLVGYDGAVKLTDFGIAKASHHGSETRPGSIQGKICYMSPEQCRGEPLDRRSDIFALGILLYELSTRTHLFDGDIELDIIHQIIRNPIPLPSDRCQNYPAELERIVLKALRADPESRYATALQLQTELEAFARQDRLAITPLAAARYLEDLLGENLTEWHDAQQAGMSLTDFVTSTMGTGTAETQPGAPPAPKESVQSVPRPPQTRAPEADSTSVGARHRIWTVFAVATLLLGILTWWATRAPVSSAPVAGPAPVERTAAPAPLPVALPLPAATPPPLAKPSPAAPPSKPKPRLRSASPKKQNWHLNSFNPPEGP